VDWDNLQLAEDVDWLNDAIQAHSVVAVADGSCLSVAYPNICSVAFILE
jgi:hypothetical protein